MATESLLANRKHWRDRAEETPSVAERTYDDECKVRLLKVVQEYERLAERAEALLRAEEERRRLNGK
jgi:hypothetical protein